MSTQAEFKPKTSIGVVGVGVDIMELKCPKCGYEWNYTGEMLTATCPSCKQNVKTEQGEQA